MKGNYDEKSSVWPVGHICACGDVCLCRARSGGGSCRVGGPRLFVVLAYAENGQQKWVTQDRATLVTQHGRIVKTRLAGDNLLEVNNLAADPKI